MKSRIISIIIAIISIAGILISCSDEPSQQIEFTCNTSNPKPMGDRSLGIDILDLNETGNFEDNIALLKEAGANYTALHINWSDVEPEQGLYRDYNGIFETFEPILKQNNLKLSLTIKPIDAIGKFLPIDLGNKRFSDSTVSARFNAMLDYLFSNFDYKLLKNLVVGNEVDLYDTDDEPGTFWIDYSQFISNINRHLDSTYSGLDLGVTVTMKNALRDRYEYRRLVDSSDFIGITYYGMHDGFIVKDRIDWLIDLTDLVTIYPNKMISFQEIGLPTSKTNYSDELTQSELICNFFKFWDLYSGQIKNVNFVRLNDYSLESAIAVAKSYGIESENFVEYLRTLGLRSYSGNGKNKEGYEMLKIQSKVR